MKVLKYILYLIGALLVIGILLGFFGPKTYDVQRSVIIEASPAQVWPYVSSLKKMNEWGPWAEQDTAMKVEYAGEDGTVGATSMWDGEIAGKGKQEIMQLDPNKYVESKLTFYMPWGEGYSTGYFHLADTSGSTHVIWGFKGEYDFLGRIYASMRSMDKAIGKEFEKGLSNLKTLVESSGMSGNTRHEVQPGDYPGGTFLGVRGKLKFEDIAAFFGKNFVAAMTALQKTNATMAGAPSGLYYDWNEETGMTEMVAAIPFTGTVKAPAGMEVVTLPPSKSLTIDYYGDYHGIGSAHEAMDAYIKANNLEPMTPAVESYITDPGSEPDTSKWLTKVTYFVK